MPTLQEPNPSTLPDPAQFVGIHARVSDFVSRGIVAAMPLEQLLLETDSPDQPGAAHRGERNEPAHLVEVLDVVANLRNMPREELAAATTANAERLFEIDLR